MTLNTHSSEFLPIQNDPQHSIPDNKLSDAHRALRKIIDGLLNSTPHAALSISDEKTAANEDEPALAA